ncbi:AAA family ATPase [Bacillus marinisedimentorum]|uniref:AAA family ATPase n=1 Tax=Bacillus marinisedimentorum TaxID=1821260 RepID=UPI001FDEF795|nr:AAA family ATPase [Bacillus marinisedimentorum]
MAAEQKQTNKNGKLIAVCSGKGGSGRTALSVNLAAAIVKKNKNVALVDADLQFGDISLAMDLQAGITIKDAAEEAERLDAIGMESYLTGHESGVKVLPAPERPEYADLVTNEKLGRILELLLEQFDYVVADTEVGLTERSVHLFEQADEILLLTNLEMAALKNTKRMLETLETLGLREKIRLVINRADMESVIKGEDVPGIIGMEDPIYIPNDFQIVSRSINIGVPFVVNNGKSNVARAVFKMAETVASGTAAPLRPKKNSFLSKLIPRSSRSTGYSGTR